MKLQAFSFALPSPTNLVEDRILEGVWRAISKDQNVLEMVKKRTATTMNSPLTTKSVTLKVTKSVVLTESLTDEEQRSVKP